MAAGAVKIAVRLLFAAAICCTGILVLAWSAELYYLPALLSLVAGIGILVLGATYAIWAHRLRPLSYITWFRSRLINLGIAKPV